MQLEFELNIETVKKKTKTQKEEELKYVYSERLFHGSLERMCETWNTPADDSDFQDLAD